MITTNTSLKTLSHLLLMLMMICSPISVVISQQTITSSCTSPKKMDVDVIGIHNTGNREILFDSGTNRATIECTCRDKNTGPCPNTVTFTIDNNGTPQQVVATAATVNVGSDYTGGYPMKIYRAIYSGAASKVTYNAPALASRPSMRGLTVWQESVGNGIPNVPNNYIVDRFFYRAPGHIYYINMPTSSVEGDFVLQIPVHEHSNNPNRPITYQVIGYNGSTPTTYIKNETFNDNNDEGEIRLDEIPLNNVPTNVTRVQVTIQSPESNGGSFLIGSIMVTSSTPCCIPTLTCPSNITRSTDAGRCDYTVQGAELNPTLTGGCSGTPTNSYNGNSTLAGAIFPVGTTTVTWSVSGLATCQVTITVEDNEAPVLTCPPNMTIIAEAGICEGFAEWETSVSDNCGAAVTWSHQSGDAFPIGVTMVTGTATDTTGNTDTCTFGVTVVQCDTCVTTETIIHIDDNDINIGTNDMESFWHNPLYRFLNPGLPAVGVLTNITLELYARVFDGSCESDIEVRVTDPMGNMTIFEQPFSATCDGKGLYHIVLDLPDVALEGDTVGTWYIEFRDTNDQNTGAAEYSARFARLTYDATFDECYNTERISTYNENELLSGLSEVRLYPVPTSSVLNMEYTSDDDTDLSIEIFDGAGRVVGYQKESAISGVNTFNMNVHSLAQGLYYVRIMDNVGRMQVKSFTKVAP